MTRLPDNVLAALRDPHRLAMVAAYAAAERSPDADFDRLTSLAAAIMDAPIALIGIVGSDRQWMKSCHGIDLRETPVEAFGAHVIAAGEGPVVVEDALADPRYRTGPLVTKEPRARFFAGVPVVVQGARLGSLSVIDHVARKRPDPEKLKQLTALAELAGNLFVLKEGTRSGLLMRAALAREEKRRAIAVEAANLATWVWDVRTDIIECDALLAEFFGLPPTNRLTARQIFQSIDQRDMGQARASFRAAIAGTDDYSGEYRVRAFDPPRWLAAQGRVVERAEDGSPLLIVGVNFDVTERRAAQERQRVLLRELNHRVKNTLATVQALATQTVRHARQPSEFLDAFSGRLQAMGQAHSLLSDHEWRGVRLGELVRRETRPFDVGPAGRIRLTGEDVLLSPDQALGVGLILHELASNALRHGSLSTPDGTVDISWHVKGRRGHRRLILEWQESGGPEVSPPERQGFGTILIRRSLAKVLDSEVTHDFLPEGVNARIVFPLEAEAAPE